MAIRHQRIQIELCAAVRGVCQPKIIQGHVLHVRSFAQCNFREKLGGSITMQEDGGVIIGAENN